MAKLGVVLKVRVGMLSEMPDKGAFIEQFRGYATALLFHKKLKTDLAVSEVALNGAIEALEGLCDPTAEKIHDALIAKAEEKGLKKGQILWPVRVAVTGQESTPGGAVEMIDILGKEESLRRMRFSLALIAAAENA